MDELYQKAVALMQAAKWPSSELLQRIYTDMEAAWSSSDEAVNARLVQCCESLGRTSSLTGKTMWTLADAEEHEELLVIEKERERELLAVVDEAVANVATVTAAPDNTKELELLNRNWREAIDAKRLNVQQSKAHRDAVIAKARQDHIEYELQWDKHVAATREALKQARGS